jgi:hypothetical protein
MSGHYDYNAQPEQQKFVFCASRLNVSDKHATESGFTLDTIHGVNIT